MDVLMVFAALAWALRKIYSGLGGYVDRMVYGDPEANRRIARAIASAIR